MTDVLITAIFRYELRIIYLYYMLWVHNHDDLILTPFSKLGCVVSSVINSLLRVSFNLIIESEESFCLRN
jgi:hypothetical protein